MKVQLHSGYILKTTNDLLKQVNTLVDIESLLHSISVFEIESNLNKDELKPINDPLLTVLDNLLSRGLPTFASVFVEEIITNLLEIADKKVHEKTGEIIFELNGDFSEKYNELLFNSFCVVDPRIQDYSTVKQDYDSWEEHTGSEFEEIFYKLSLPEHFDSSVCQLIESQRIIESILEFPLGIDRKVKQQLGALKNDFYKQRVDFSLQFPNANNHKSGMVIEIDGSQHSNEQQRQLDQKRDQVIEKNGWSETVRIKTNQVASIPIDEIEQINEFLLHPYFKTIKSNYENPIWINERGLEALQLTLTPIGIARIQKTIVYLLNQGVLNLKSKVWKFAFIERDVPCAELAMQDLQQLCDNLFELEGENRKLPPIEYKIYSTEEFENCQLNNEVKADSYPSPSKSYSCDFLFDISILQRSGLSHIDKPFIDKVKMKNVVTIRSSHSQKEHRLIKSAKPLTYKIGKDEQPSALVYFLQNIFRKNEFREGQVNILKRSLKQENVIALLPTGAGKSLTYQLSALLQPGIVLIVDPLKSLMKDQNDNLKSAGLDSTVFINSSIKSPVEREDRCEKMVKGYYQFIFISPERLQIPEFRDYLRKMTETFFTYCVVDEAHCVSEWGHDFRTSYLRLGQNAREYCKTLSDNIPILGLTGTASYDVLADVQRELEINEESAIVEPAKYEREELNFEIIDVGKPEIPEGLEDDRKIKGLVADHKQLALHNYLNELPSKEWGNGCEFESIEEFLSHELDYKNSGLIFCPHVGWKFGVKNIHSEIVSQFKVLETSTGMYAGSLDDDSIDLDEVQNQFKSNDLNLLVATKAFGMGIDKPNIRFTIHFNMPQSIESFYQEAGRAGRDKEKAFCSILYSPTTINEQINGEDTQISIDKSLMISFYYNSFRGIEKERRIMWELLNEISFPYTRTLDALDEIIFDLDIEVKFNVWQMNQHNRLYVNGEQFPESYGYIDLNNEIISPENRDDRMILSFSESQDLLIKIKTRLKENCPSNKSFLQWITHQENIEPKPGFEKILANMNVGDNPKKVVVGFTNDRTKIIEDYLTQFDNAWEETMILKANNYCFTPSEFIKNLGLEYWKKTNENFDFNNSHVERISSLYYQVRDESDTFKAIYRLSVIGVVDDYEVDYRTKTITATISKKKDEDHINLLKQYIGRYVSTAEENKVPNQINEFRGDTILQKCCGLLAKFVYEEIAVKRFNAITSMETAITRGIDKKEDFATEINMYFDSKYYRSLSDVFRSNDIEVVWSFMNKTKGVKDSLQHLNGACTRLLDDSPNSSVLLLLRAFSRLLIENYNKSDAIDDFRKGWKIFKELKEWSRAEYYDNFSDFYRIADNYDPSSVKYLNNEIVIDHLNWLKKFNKTFLKGIAYA